MNAPAKPIVGHTPGPWGVPSEYSDFQIHGPDGMRVADVLTLQRHASECEANARLIAAAPELLSVCKWALQYFIDAHAGIPEFGEDGDREVWRLIHDGEAAIAKAEGRES